MSEMPAIGYGVGSCTWQVPMSHALPGETCVRSVFNVDAICQAFHRTTLGLALPYDTWGDDMSIFFSAYISNMEVSAFYPHSRVGYFNVEVSVDRNQHLHHIRRNRRLGYIRSQEWHKCKQYMEGAFVNPTIRSAIDESNCGTAANNDYCERHACGGRVERTGPVDFDWMKDNLNLHHPWASKKIAFIQRWSSFLDRNRTAFVRERDDCSGRSPTGDRCLA